MAKRIDERQHRGSGKDENRRRRLKLVASREGPSWCGTASVVDEQLRRLIREVQERQKPSRTAQQDGPLLPAA